MPRNLYYSNSRSCLTLYIFNNFEFRFASKLTFMHETIKGCCTADIRKVRSHVSLTKDLYGSSKVFILTNFQQPWTFFTNFNESKCNLLKVSSEPLRACRQGDNDIAISQMLPDQQPDKLSVSVAREVAPCALGLKWLATSVSRILVVQD